MASDPKVVPGIEPVGTVRRSQTITTFTIGSVVDLEKGSCMPMGLEDWEGATKRPSLTINEKRLQLRLGIDHFRLAPLAKPIEGTRLVDIRSTAPARRFPAWHECPACHRLGCEGDPFELHEDGVRLRCLGHTGRKPFVNPVRFVIACRAGHIEDFPWEWWTHKERDEGICTNPALYLRSLGKSAALSDLFVECKSCVSGEKPTRASLGGIFGADSLGKRQCRGTRPWLFDHEEGCEQLPRVVQRGASNIHFPALASALSIPPVSEAAFQIIEDVRDVLESVPEEAWPSVLNGLADKYGVDPQALRSAFAQYNSLDEGEARLSESEFRAEEYAALCEDRDDEAMGGKVPNFENSVRPPPKELSNWFDLVGSVYRLREVRALGGFSRIEPYPVSADKFDKAIAEGKLAPLSKTKLTWLPAAEIFGEGIFLRFSLDAIERWLDSNPEVIERCRELDVRSAEVAVARGYDRDYQITPRLILVHSFAHALIRQISIDCGYSTASIRERLYVSEPEGSNPGMAGVMIFTGSPDSDGSLGGLVRLSEPQPLVDLVQRTIANAEWCGSDPVCLETEPEQMGERISGAACHCCLLLPETSCEKFNRELDRALLVGDADNRFDGYFTGGIN